jgi:hypothetical protein
LIKKILILGCPVRLRTNFAKIFGGLIVNNQALSEKQARAEELKTKLLQLENIKKSLLKNGENNENLQFLLKRL